MKHIHAIATAVAALCLVACTPKDDDASVDGSVALFNAENLEGWSLLVEDELKRQMCFMAFC